MEQGAELIEQMTIKQGKHYLVNLGRELCLRVVLHAAGKQLRSHPIVHFVEALLQALPGVQSLVPPCGRKSLGASSLNTLHRSNLKLFSETSGHFSDVDA